MIDFSTSSSDLPLLGPLPTPTAFVRVSSTLVTQRRTLDTYHELIKMLSDCCPVIDILSRILKELASLTQAADVRLFLVEPKSRSLHQKMNLQGSVSNVQISLNSGMVSEVVKTGEELHAADCQSHSAFDPTVDLLVCKLFSFFLSFPPH